MNSSHQPSCRRRCRCGDPVLPAGPRRNAHREEPEARTRRKADHRLRRRQPHGHGFRRPPGAHVVLTSDKDDLESRFDLKLEELPGEVRITLKKKDALTSWTGWFNNSKIRFEIQVPTKTTTDLQTGGGHVTVSALEGDAHAETSGRPHRSRPIFAETSPPRRPAGTSPSRRSPGTPRWKPREATSRPTAVDGDLFAETSGGHIEIRGAKGRVDADTSGGHVEVSFAKGNARGGKIESSGGGISVAVDPNVDLAIDASDLRRLGADRHPGEDPGQGQRFEHQGIARARAARCSTSTPRAAR